MVIRGTRFLRDSFRGPSSWLDGEVWVWVPGRKQIPARDVEFRVDTAADKTLLGTDAVLSMRLKRRHMEGLVRLGDYKGKFSAVWVMPGYLSLRHQREPLQRWSRSTVFMLNFHIPTESFEDPESDEAQVSEEIDSLLGQDVLPYLKPTGIEEKGLYGEFNYQFWEAPQNRIESEPYFRAIPGTNGLFIPDPILRAKKIEFERRLNQRGR